MTSSSTTYFGSVAGYGHMMSDCLGVATDCVTSGSLSGDSFSRLMLVPCLFSMLLLMYVCHHQEENMLAGRHLASMGHLAWTVDILVVLEYEDIHHCCCMTTLTQSLSTCVHPCVQLSGPERIVEDKEKPYPKQNPRLPRALPILPVHFMRPDG